MCSLRFLSLNISFTFVEVRSAPSFLYEVFFFPHNRIMIYKEAPGQLMITGHRRRGMMHPRATKRWAGVLIQARKVSGRGWKSHHAPLRFPLSAGARRGTTAWCGVPLRITRAVMADLRGGYSPVAGSSARPWEGSGPRVRWLCASSPGESRTYAYAVFTTRTKPDNDAPIPWPVPEREAKALQAGMRGRKSTHHPLQ